MEPLRYAPSVATHSSGSRERPSGIGGMIWSLRHRRRVQRAIRELSSLSNATLEDIGIERGNIPDIVEEMMKPASTPPSPHTFGKAHDAGYSVPGSAAA